MSAVIKIAAGELSQRASELLVQAAGPLGPRAVDIETQAEPLNPAEDMFEMRRVIVANKVDLPARWSTDALPAAAVETSMTTEAGVGALRASLAAALGSAETPPECPRVANVRHIELLERATACLERAARAARAEDPEEVVLADLHEAGQLLGEIAGRRTSEDVLQRIFERFCVGK